MNMFPSDGNISDLAQAIQLALTPVFLLTGIAGMLNVMTGRLSRIIDRGRHVAEGDLQFDPSMGEAVRNKMRAAYTALEGGTPSGQ